MKLTLTQSLKFMKGILLLSALLVSLTGCKSTPNSSYLSQCKMKDSDNYGQIMPIRFEPAAKRGETGVVIASFSILQDGSIGDIAIVEAKPKRVFNRSAKRTLEQVECRPVMMNGQAVKVTNQTVTLNFNHIE